MRSDAAELARWYQDAAGHRARDKIRQAVQPLVRTGATMRLLGLGYCSPLFNPPEIEHFERLIIAEPPSPDGTTAAPWPKGHANLVTEVSEDTLPFADALFDQVIVAHMLEHCAQPRRFMREIWRILAPGGSVILLVPNRMGLWVHFEGTPFGQGSPFGQHQITRLVTDALFEIDHQQTLLAMPPLQFLSWLDRPMIRMAPRLGGLHLIRAIKTEGAQPLIAGRTGHSGRTAKRLRPAFENQSEKSPTTGKSQARAKARQ